MAQITKRERVRGTLRGEVVDRPPLTFWHHFRPHGSARALAEATLAFFGRYDLDIYKIMPDLPYPFPHDGIRTLDDWHLLTPLSTESGNFARQVDAVWRVRTAIGPDVPLISTLFSPLTEALYFSTIERFRISIQESPGTVHGALAVLTDNLARLGAALLDAGADGIFLSVQGAGNDLLTAAQFAEFGRPYDMALLSAWREGWLNILHAHAEHDLRIEEVLNYPVAVFSWSDRFTGIPLRQVWDARPDAAVMGGLHERGAIVTGPADAIAAEMADALAQTDGGRRLILAPGCSVPDDTPDQWLRAARQAVERPG
ncbi:MAG TPA: uroporphyrinogen decarboxylase family protein [Chloroflexota bacterium]|jgi:uroporphyrinogen decarboxylase|nr:uroporphyrinogen decarboxylase family protein [Chloroflexota bacterium]